MSLTSEANRPPSQYSASRSPSEPPGKHAACANPDETAYIRLSVKHCTPCGRIRIHCPPLKGTGDRAQFLARFLQHTLSDMALQVRPTGSILLRIGKDHPAREVASRIRHALQAGQHAYRRGEAMPPPTETENRDTKPVEPPDKPWEVYNRQSQPPATERNWHTIPISQLKRALDLDDMTGLTDAEARTRLSRHGPNSLPSPPSPSAMAPLFDQFKSMPVAMLGGSAVISALTGGLADAVATLSIVAVNGVIGFVTEGQAENTISRLTSPVDENTNVVRNGSTRPVLVRDIVPGDLITLKPGTRVPADARVLSGDGLMVDESSLTGESEPVIKRGSDYLAAATPMSGRANMIYAGTLIAAGTGQAVVVATGPAMEIAQVQTLSETSERPRAPIEDELDKLGQKLVSVSVAACGLFFAVGALRGQSVSVMLKEALALAVAAVPEGLPTVATTTLALGLKRMERRNIFIRHLNVVESLGALQTICLDKTGTLTENKMAVDVVVVGGKQRTVDECLADPETVQVLAEIAALNNDGVMADNGRTAIGSSATEHALLEFAVTVGVDADALRAEHIRESQVDRATNRRFMTTVHRNSRNDVKVLVKGTPDDVLERCRWYFDGTDIQTMTDSTRQAIRQQNDTIAARPARVLAFATADRRPDSGGEVSELTWVGVIGMTDPIRAGAKDFIKSLHTAGIETILITGDQAATAEAVARDLDLSGGAPLQTIDSSNLDMLDTELLTEIAKKTHVFARVNPREKLLIVRALQASGRVVAMTGDGVNDGPALKAADVGIAMGKNGTDIAREIANVVIADDELPTLIDAIAQGRAIYRNIRRSLEFLVATNLSEIMVEIIEALHGPGELETPMELLWINLATDVAPGLGLALASPDDDAMAVPPRKLGEPIIPTTDFKRMAVNSGLISASAMASHLIGLSRYGPGPQTRGMTFLTLSLGQLLYTLGCQRTDPRKIHLSRLFENRILDLSLLTSIGFTAVPFFVPGLRRLLGIAPLRASELATAIGLAAVPLGFVLSQRGLSFHPETEMTVK